MLGQQVTELEENLRLANVALKRMVAAESMLDNALQQWKNDTIQRIDSVNTEARIAGDADLELSKFDSIITTMLSMRLVFKATGYSYKLKELCQRMADKLSRMFDYRATHKFVCTRQMQEKRQQLGCLKDMFWADESAYNADE